MLCLSKMKRFSNSVVLTTLSCFFDAFLLRLRAQLFGALLWNLVFFQRCCLRGIFISMVMPYVINIFILFSDLIKFKENIPIA